jgi:hypothetical protein
MSAYPPAYIKATMAEVCQIFNDPVDRQAIFDEGLPYRVLSNQSFWQNEPTLLAKLTDQAQKDLKVFFLTQGTSSPPPSNTRRSLCPTCKKNPAGFSSAPFSMYCSPDCRRQRKRIMITPALQEEFSAFLEAKKQRLTEMTDIATTRTTELLSTTGEFITENASDTSSSDEEEFISQEEQIVQICGLLSDLGLKKLASHHVIEVLKGSGKRSTKADRVRCVANFYVKSGGIHKLVKDIQELRVEVTRSLSQSDFIHLFE